MQLTQSMRAAPVERRCEWQKLARQLFLISCPLWMALVMAGGDALLAWRPAGPWQPYWALVDPPVHAALALLAVAPLILRGSARAALSRAALSRAALAGLAAVLIDLDHALAAGSFSVYAMTHLGGRPETHSLLFVLGCGLFAWGISRRGEWGWLLGLALLSHVLRDASSGGTPLLWPFFDFERLSLPAYYAAQVGLFVGGWVVRQFPLTPSPSPTRGEGRRAASASAPRRETRAANVSTGD